MASHSDSTDPAAALHIIHLSDLHFGDGHRFDPKPAPDGHHPSHRGHPTLLDSLVDDLKDTHDLAYPVLICITGDFGNTKPAEELPVGRKFLEGLMQSPILGQVRSQDCFVVIPGNHDLVLGQVDQRERWVHWAKLTESLLSPSMDPADPFSFATVQDRFDELKAIVLTLNSCAYIRKPTSDEKTLHDAHRGEVDFQHIMDVDRALASFPPEKLASAIRIALIHHHPILYPSLADPKTGYDAVLNSGELLHVLRKYGFHLLLHGHKHLPHICTYDLRVGLEEPLRPLLMVGAGSVGYKWTLPIANVNSYNRITIKWHPRASEARIVVNTRVMRWVDDHGNAIMPYNWKWENGLTEDRAFTAPSRLPSPSFSPELISHSDLVLEKRRVTEFEQLRGNIPVVEVLPSLKPDQSYEARLWLARHDDKSATRPVEVVWSAGLGRPAIRVKRSDDEHFCAAMDYRGAMFIQAQLTFDRGEVAVAHVYARLPRSYDQRERSAPVAAVRTGEQ